MVLSCYWLSCHCHFVLVLSFPFVALHLANWHEVIEMTLTARLSLCSSHISWLHILFSAYPHCCRLCWHLDRPVLFTKKPLGAHCSITLSAQRHCPSPPLAPSLTTTAVFFSSLSSFTLFICVCLRLLTHLFPLVKALSVPVLHVMHVLRLCLLLPRTVVCPVCKVSKVTTFEVMECRTWESIIPINQGSGQLFSSSSETLTPIEVSVLSTVCICSFWLNILLQFLNHLSHLHCDQPFSCGHIHRDKICLCVWFAVPSVHTYRCDPLLSPFCAVTSGKHIQHKHCEQAEPYVVTGKFHPDL